VVGHAAYRDGDRDRTRVFDVYDESVASLKNRYLLCVQTQLDGPEGGMEAAGTASERRGRLSYEPVTTRHVLDKTSAFRGDTV